MFWTLRDFLYASMSHGQASDRISDVQHRTLGSSTARSVTLSLPLPTRRSYITGHELTA